MTFYRDLAGNVHEGPKGYDAMDILLPYMKDMDDRVDGQRQQLLHKIDMSYKVGRQRLTVVNFPTVAEK